MTVIAAEAIDMLASSCSNLIFANVSVTVAKVTVPLTLLYPSIVSASALVTLSVTVMFAVVRFTSANNLMAARSVLSSVMSATVTVPVVSPLSVSSFVLSILLVTFTAAAAIVTSLVVNPSIEIKLS